MSKRKKMKIDTKEKKRSREEYEEKKEAEG